MSKNWLWRLKADDLVVTVDEHGLRRPGRVVDLLAFGQLSVVDARGAHVYVHESGHQVPAIGGNGPPRIERVSFDNDDELDALEPDEPEDLTVVFEDIDPKPAYLITYSWTAYGQAPTLASDTTRKHPATWLVDLLTRCREEDRVREGRSGPTPRRETAHIVNVVEIPDVSDEVLEAWDDLL
jgi:hypothetical protein